MNNVFAGANIYYHILRNNFLLSVCFLVFACICLWMCAFLDSDAYANVYTSLLFYVANMICTCPSNTRVSDKMDIVEKFVSVD